MPLIGSPGVVDAHGVRVDELADGARLLLEAFDEDRVIDVLGAQDLDRHGALEGLLIGEENARHTARVERAVDAVTACQQRPSL